MCSSFLAHLPVSQRFSVLSALNAITKELVMITEHTYINATSVCALSEKLHEQFRDLPIVLIMVMPVTNAVNWFQRRLRA